MSLINEALKKAQQERARQASPLQGSREAPAAARPVPAATSAGFPFFRLFIGLVIAGSALASAVAFMVFLYVQTRTPVPVQPIAAEPVRLESAPVTLQAPAPVISSTSTEPLLVMDELPDLPTTRLDPPSGPEIETTPPVPPPAVAETKPTPVETRPPPVDPEPLDTPAHGLAGSPKDPATTTPDPAPAIRATGPPPDHQDRVNDYLRHLTVSGIRLSGPDSKVVLNNRVYRLTETVLDTDFYLKIVGIEHTQIHFQDEYGKRHLKRF